MAPVVVDERLIEFEECPFDRTRQVGILIQGVVLSNDNPDLSPYQSGVVQGKGPIFRVTGMKGDAEQPSSPPESTLERMSRKVVRGAPGRCTIKIRRACSRMNNRLLPSPLWVR